MNRVEAFSKSDLVQKQMSRDKSKVIDLIKQTLYNSTAQALHKIYTSTSRLIQAFWCVCLMGACASCAYFVIESLITFFSYEVSMNTRIYFETESLFPKVTFCNKNLYTTKYAYDLFQNMTTDDIAIYINHQLNDSVRAKLHHSLEDTMFECSFNTVKCMASEFQREYDKNLGNCFSFNSGYVWAQCYEFD